MLNWQSKESLSLFSALALLAMLLPHGKFWPNNSPSVLTSRLESYNWVASHLRHIHTFLSHQHGSFHLNIAWDRRLAPHESVILGKLEFAMGLTLGSPPRSPLRDLEGHFVKFVCVWKEEKSNKISHWLMPQGSLEFNFHEANYVHLLCQKSTGFLSLWAKILIGIRAECVISLTHPIPLLLVVSIVSFDKGRTHDSLK